jgi:hypothetical protein
MYSSGCAQRSARRSMSVSVLILPVYHRGRARPGDTRGWRPARNSAIRRSDLVEMPHHPRQNFGEVFESWFGWLKTNHGTRQEVVGHSVKASCAGLSDYGHLLVRLQSACEVSERVRHVNAWSEQERSRRTACVVRPRTALGARVLVGRSTPRTRARRTRSCAGWNVPLRRLLAPRSTRLAATLPFGALLPLLVVIQDPFDSDRCTQGPGLLKYPAVCGWRRAAAIERNRGC